jgi:hypothetical protein
LLSAQIKVDRAKQTKHKPESIQKLADTLGTVTRQHPELPETWQAVALLASYRASDVLEKSAPLPDCDISQKPHVIALGDVPELPTVGGVRGYIFRNCRLHMDHLPSGKLAHGYFSSGKELWGGVDAVVINSEIVLNDSGIAESDIISFEAVNCRFEFQVEHVPAPSTQRLLLASLDTPVAGQFSTRL